MHAEQPSRAASRIRRIRFLATRIAGTDGVSLETRKWVTVLEQMGYECFLMAGELDQQNDHTSCIAEAAFSHPEIADIQKQCFGRDRRTPQLSKRINESLVRIKDDTIEDTLFRREMVEQNYKLGRQFFSHSGLKAKLHALLTEFAGIDHQIRNEGH